MIRLAVLGSTGSVGSQTLEVAKSFPDDIKVVALCARRASEKLLAQVRKFKPELVVTHEEPSGDWKSSLPEGVRYSRGDEGIEEAISLSDKVMNSIAGVHGIKPAYRVLSAGKILLASNKESIVCLPKVVEEHRNLIVPVDSEHNALFQLLEGVDTEDIRSVYLTASGGPFRKWSLEEMEKATPEEALRHPRWNMGAKITVDSATLMNKGFEMLEAKNLFGIDLTKIRVIIHPQSVVHGIVELKDGSFFMHAGPTDMRVPILHALFYPARREYPFQKSDLTDLSPITFEEVDGERFRALDIAKSVGQRGGVYVPVLVGADEEAVELFLSKRIGFLDITRIIEETLSEVDIPDPKTVEDVLEAVSWARRKVREIYEKRYARAR